MTVLMGKVLLFLSCLWVGLDRARRRRARTACLRAFRQAVADLTREMSFSLDSLDRLIRRAGEGEGPVPAFFAACGEKFRQTGGESWADSWQRALDAAALPVGPADRALFARAGELLGRWDGETQRKALGDLLSQLDEAIFDGAEEEKRLGRVDLTLGLTAGLFCVLLF